MDSIKQENPWLVPNIDEFLFYCCPECDAKCKDGESFYNHALSFHELARISLANSNPDDSYNDYDPQTEPQNDFQNEPLVSENPVNNEEDIKPNVADLANVILKTEPNLDTKKLAKKPKSSKPLEPEG